MSVEKPDAEKKLYVDEDWKSRVEAEKQADSHSHKSSDPGGPKAADEELPPPTLAFLAGTIYLQGMVAMGMLPHPATDKAEVHLNQARHSIDLLAVLFDKTEGNRTNDESEEMENMLHQLRLAYVTYTTGSA